MYIVMQINPEMLRWLFEEVFAYGGRKYMQNTGHNTFGGSYTTAAAFNRI